MFELAFFIVPSFFTYLGYIYGQRRKHLDIFSQWVFLPVLFIYSFISFMIYFLGYDLLFSSQCNYFDILHKTGMGQIKECINEMSFTGLCTVCITAYIIGFFLKRIRPVRFLRFLNLFYQIEPISETRNIIEKTLNKTPLIVFLDNSHVHVGIPTFYDTDSKGVQCFDVNLMFSGYKKDGEISYYTNYLKLSKSIKRLFYLKKVTSIGEFNYKTFLYFLDQKINKNQTETALIKQLKNQGQEIE